MDTVPHSLTECFQQLPDPRVENRSDHKLLDIVLIVLCATIAGADDFVAIADFARAQEDWLRQRLQLQLPAGIPSHDTLNRVFALIKPQEFQKCLDLFVQLVTVRIPGPPIEVVAVDGKAMRGSKRTDETNKTRMTHIVSAWANSRGITLGQVKTDEKSNEITAIPELLNLIDISGALVTIDALGCQTEIASEIRSCSADYLLQVKGNQPHLLEDIQRLAESQLELDYVGCNTFEQVEEKRVHGREETRTCVVIDDAKLLKSELRGFADWKDLKSVVLVTSARKVGAKSSIETRYYISSKQMSAEAFLASTRCHWGIENGCHWVLDVAFREDDHRLREGHATENLSVVRRMALTMLKNVDCKCGIKNRRLRAGWDTTFLEKILKVFRRI